MPFATQDLLKLLMKFRNSRWFRVSYVILLGVVTFALFRFLFTGSATFCLGALLIPITIFVFPYWLGERKVKNFVINAAPIFVIALLLISAFQTQASLVPSVSESFPPPDASTHVAIFNGTVSPFSASPSTTFNFTARVKTFGGVNNTTVLVLLNVTTIQGISVGSTQPYRMLVDTSANNTNGTWYYYAMPLGSDIYEFNFFANDTHGNVTESLPLLGPITAPYLNYYFLWAYILLSYLIIPFLLYFIIVFMFWYLARTRRQRAKMLETAEKKEEEAAEKGGGESKKKEAKEPAPKALPGDKTKKAAAFTCTNCGADVTEDDEKCPSCGAVFED